MSATIYSASDGSVRRVIETDNGDLLMLNIGEGELAKTGNWLGWRIDLETNEAAPLLAFDVTVGANMVTGVPAGTMVQIGWVQPEQCDDGVVEIAVDYPEDVRVELVHPLYETVVLAVPCA